MPSLFYGLILWTCYDLFLTSLLISLMFYLLISLYYYKVGDFELNEAIRLNVEKLINDNKKFYNMLIGYFWGNIFFLYIYYLIL